MSRLLELADVARLPTPGDNVAIATDRIEAGSELSADGKSWRIPYTVLVGHRFAVGPIRIGEELLSWGRPFGVAVSPIVPGEYVCNREMLDALSIRDLGASLPTKPNFENRIVPYRFDEKAFRPAPPIDRIDKPTTFTGYRRPGKRGVGTRNYMVVLGTSSRTAGFARLLAERAQPLLRDHPTIDGIVALAHTEGGDPNEPNNMKEALRALAGFLVHPNVGAILAVDHGVEPLNNVRLRDFALDNGYPLDAVVHRFLTIRHGVPAALAEGEAQLRSWMSTVEAAYRSEEPLAGSSVALQCGGSDAFSGISGNPLAGAVAHEVVRHGGRAVLTETDELIGAEAHILANMRDLATARKFIAAIEGFKNRLSWHGVSAEANPSGGNKLRGLYNIVLKSLGAAAKKSPHSRVEDVIDYAELLRSPGYYFMNGPGNDLEGVAGQIATGCNLVIFVTGNGSITNFPFVPTIKVTTTTQRHQLLVNEMDVNAGRYLEGVPMPVLCDETFELLRGIASGRRSQGEKAGHSQVSIWRNWRQTDTSRLAELQNRRVPDGVPISLRSASGGNLPASTFSAFSTGKGWATDRLGLIVPSSLCSSEIVRMAASRLNQKHVGHAAGISRFVALAHTEGCGFGGQSHHERLARTYRGYAAHPNVALALFLEHGCEKVPNDLIRKKLDAAGTDSKQFGWASVQLDGGIEKVLTKVEQWFEKKAGELAPATTGQAGPESLAVGILSSNTADPGSAMVLAKLTQWIVESGGTVLIPESDPLLKNPGYRELLIDSQALHSTLSYGEPFQKPGFHVVETETDHWTENLTGLGACGAKLFVALASEHSRPGHPMLPVIQITDPQGLAASEVDSKFTGSAVVDTEQLRAKILAVASREYQPVASASGLTDFQITRGYLGVTT